MTGFEDLPDELLCLIFSNLNTFKKVQLSRVCRRWRRVSKGRYVWEKVLLGYQRCVTQQAFDKLVFSTTTEIAIDECHSLEWKEVRKTIQRCQKLTNFSCSWIGYPRQTVLDLSQVNGFQYLKFLNISNCVMDDFTLRSLPDVCPDLKIFIMAACKSVHHQVLRSSKFKSSRLELINIAYCLLGKQMSDSAQNLQTLTEVFKYNGCLIKVDITGIHLSDDDYDELLRVHADVEERIVEVDDYRQLLPW